MNAFLHALNFLTRLPTGHSKPYDASLAGPAVSYYSGVGLLIGILFLLAAAVFSSWLDVPPLPTAAVLLCLWVWVTGALHLDGLGDCADAWMSGASKERSLEIMKDTHCGVGAIVAIILLLIVKFSALATILQGTATDGLFLLVIAPAVARILLSFAVCQFVYVRTSGLGSSLKAGLVPQTIAIVSGLLLLALALIAFKATLFALVGGLVGFFIIYLGIIKKINGITGDVYGALIEVTEATALLGIVVSLS